MIHNTTISPTRKPRQPRRAQKRTYKAGDVVTISADYPPSSRTVQATIKRITTKDSGIRGIEIVTYVLKLGDTHSRVMSSAEFNQSVRS